MKIYFKELYNSVTAVLFEPVLFWKKQKSYTPSILKPVTHYIGPLVLFSALCIFAGELFRGSRLYLFFPVMKAVRKMVLFMLYYFIMIFIIKELMALTGIKKDIRTSGKKDIRTLGKLISYSLTPVIITSFFTGLFPFLYVLDIFGLYGFYIFLTGIKTMFQFRDKGQYAFFISVVISALVIYGILSIILSKLLTAIL